MIKISTRGIPELVQLLKDLPRGTKIVAMRAAAEYLVGDESHGLKHEPAQKFVSRAKAYGNVSDAPPGYFSWKQFRYVAWITDGFTKIPYNRTHEMSRAWTATTQTSDWTRVKIENDAPGAQWVYGEQQARQPALVGWKKFTDIIASNIAGAVRAAQQAVDRWIKERNK